MTVAALLALGAVGGVGVQVILTAGSEQNGGRVPLVPSSIWRLGECGAKLFRG